MPKPKDTRNPTRAYAYVTQALDLLDKVESGIHVGAIEPGELVSLRRNLESAKADLTPPKEGD